MKDEDTDCAEAMFQVAAELIQRPLRPNEEEAIIDAFNAAHGDNYERVKSAIKRVTGKDVPETSPMFESGGSINNLANKVAALKLAVKRWGGK